MTRRLPVLIAAAAATFVAVSPLPLARAAEPAQRPAPRAPSEMSMAAAVGSKVPVVEFNQVAISDVIDFMRDVANLNIYVNWAALEAAGVDRSMPVTIKLRQIKLGKVLDITLQQVGRGTLSWYVSDNIIHVTTREIADRDLVTRIYPVQDLLVEIPNFRGPDLSLDGGGGGGGEDGGGGASPFSGSSNDNSDQESTTMQERGEKLVELIISVVSPDVWVENGGFSRIRYFNGNLIVTAPRSVQAQIGR